MRRGVGRKVLAGTALALAALGPSAVAKPQKPPKPEVKLLTERQQTVLKKRAVELGVESKRGKRTRVEAELVVKGYPDPYDLSLGPERKRLRGGKAEVSLPLTRRQRVVLAYGVQACWKAELSAEARVGDRTAELSEPLRRPRSCTG